MTIIMRYKAPSFYMGMSGAWFEGRAYLQKRSVKKFIPFSCIAKTLRDAEGSKNVRLSSEDTGKIGRAAGYEYLIQDFERAYAEGFEAISHRLDREAKTGKSTAYIFQRIAHGRDIVSGSVDSDYALFKCGDKKTAVEASGLRKLLGSGAGTNNPEKIEYYFNSKAASYFYSGHELRKAQTAFEKSPEIKALESAPLNIDACRFTSTLPAI